LYSFSFLAAFPERESHSLPSGPHPPVHLSCSHTPRERGREGEIERDRERRRERKRERKRKRERERKREADIERDR